VPLSVLPLESVFPVVGLPVELEAEPLEPMAPLAALPPALDPLALAPALDPPALPLPPLCARRVRARPEAACHRA
jgi:hypothetical protein